MTVEHDVLTTPEPCRTRTHEHSWLTESAHRTSLGVLRYVICPECGVRRVDLQPGPHLPPAALSVELSPNPATNPGPGRLLLDDGDHVPQPCRG